MLPIGIVGDFDERVFAGLAGFDFAAVFDLAIIRNSTNIKPNVSDLFFPIKFYKY